jgi:hypothetical protein
MIQEIRFARDSPLEEAGFEPSVPRDPSEKLNERLGRFWRFARCIDPGAENGHARQFSGQWANQLRTGDWHNFRGLGHSNLGVAFGHYLCSLGTRH